MEPKVCAKYHAIVNRCGSHSAPRTYLFHADVNGESWGGVDTWVLGNGVEVVVVWTKMRLPYTISFATEKGVQVLTPQEVDTLASYFALGPMYTKPNAAYLKDLGNRGGTGV